MTQEEIKFILEPLETEYQEIKEKLSQLKKEDYNFELRRENYLGQIHVYLHTISFLQSIHFNIALKECKKSLNIEKP